MEYIVTGKIQWDSLPPGISESAKRFVLMSASLLVSYAEMEL
jgi:hypothetical protein